MKTFVKLIAVFLAPIFLVGIAVEILERNIPNSYQLKNDELKRNSTTIQTLILGSSHSYYGLNPNYFNQKAFNFAQVSQSIDIDKKILFTYADGLQNLENVIVRLSYTTLFEQLAHTNEDWRIKDYEIYTDVNLTSNLKYQSELLSMKLENNFQDISNYYFYDKSQLFTSKSGWGNNLKGQSTAAKDKIGFTIAKKHTISNIDFFASNKKSLEEIIKFCALRNIKVYLITFPAYQSYVKNLDKNQLAVTIETGKSFQQKYSNCYYYNFLKDKRFTESDFYDVDYLNHQGSRKMSELVNKIISKN